MLRDRLRPFLRRALTTTLAFGVVTSPVLATWSIVVIDTATREIVVAGATCIPNFDLPMAIGCVAVGKGGGASQANLFADAKGIMFAGLKADKTPARILEDIFATGNAIETRQFGVVGMSGPSVTFTGNQDGLAALGVAGQVGTLRYAIQGNVLAQERVVHGALETLLNAPGDLGQRVMLAMEAATELGGDGRCSCSDGMPPCGQPTEFRRASATIFMIVARLGDTDSATCTVTSNNCANGDYYALIRKKTNFTQPDPVLIFRRKYEIWRAALSGRPDHYKTEVLQTAGVIEVGGADSTMVDISLMDVDGLPLVTGGQTLIVTNVEGPAVQLSGMTDNGDGTHQFQVTSGAQTGVARLRIVVRDGIRDVQLYPDLEVHVAAPAELFVDQYSVHAASGGLVNFSVDSPGNGGRPYQLIGSASGTQPGTPFGGVVLPLNRDPFMSFTFVDANGPQLPGSVGVLDNAGGATAQLAAPAGFLDGWIGSRLDWVVYQTPGGGVASRVTNLVGFEIVP